MGLEFDQEIFRGQVRNGGDPGSCSRGALSSLAVVVAQRFGMTLVGFLRGQRFNIYSGNWRIE
jgi:FdhD protein